MPVLNVLTNYGLTAQAQGDQLIVSPRNRLNDEIREWIRQNKPALMNELALQQVRDGLKQTLADKSDLVRAFEVVDPDSDPVRVVVAIRDIGTCDLLIARGKWCPWKFLELITKHGGSIN